MARTIRFLVFSVFLLILPSCATPPAKYPRPDALCCRTTRGKRVLIRKYLLLRRSFNGDKTKARVQIYDITVVMVLNRVTPGSAPQPVDPSNLAICTYKQCQFVPEVVDGGASNRPLSPML